jgi:hypothetical protein
MKILLLAIPLFLSYSAMVFSIAHAAPPEDNPCNKNASLAKIQHAIVGDIRGKMPSNAGAFSFHFSPVWDNKGASDLTVYFEQVSEVDQSRQGYSAEYNISAQSCTPKFEKMSPLYTEAETPTGKPPTDPCNEANSVSVLHAAIVKSMQYLGSQIYEGAQIGNFVFSSVERMKGSSDMSVLFEANRPGLLTSPMIAQFDVDPKTCAPQIKVATAFTWLLITY